jgi:transglutaminase-like putative cysteine protease
MLSRLKHRFSTEPESSLTLRYVIWAAMLVPLLALARVHSGLWPYVIVAAMGISLGHWYSYRHLETQSRTVRVLIFGAIHLALCWMFVGLAAGLVVPQAQFAIFTQAITSFDLRYRSSLFNTLLLSLAILYVAASLSRTVELAIYLLLFGSLVLAAFFIADRESGLSSATLCPRPALDRRKTRRLLSPPSRSVTTFGFGFGAAALLAIFFVFLVTPRFANRPIVPPFTLNVPLSGGITAEIINPGVPLVQINGWSNEIGDYFFGFDTNLDLRYRGGLSDQLVMYVRSPSRSYWRSHSYDYYDGISWSQSSKTLTEIRSRGVYFQLPAPPGSPWSQADTGLPGQNGHNIWYSPGARHHLREALDAGYDGGEAWQKDQQVVQTYTIVSDQPNLIFAAYRPSEIFITSENISLDGGDGIRLPEPLKAGLTYSVVSYRPEFDPELLRQVPPTAPYPPDISQRYLQLPAHISARVRALAKSLTDHADNNFDKVTALNDHLLTEYPYNFFPPAHPPGTEVVDNFLFEDRQGFCEMYVTSLVVMARSLGIPARLTTGYGAGNYNPITGYYEVRFSHAHSWAEVYFPEYGWVPFDPTPGWEPQPYPTPVQNWLFSDDGRLLNRLADLNLPWREMSGGGITGLVIAMPAMVAGVLLIGLMVLAVMLGRRLRRLLANWPTDRYTKMAQTEPSRRRILRIYRQGVRLLSRKKQRHRQPWQTAAEYADSIDDVPALTQLTQLAEVAAYRPQAPDAGSVTRAKQALANLRREL